MFNVPLAATVRDRARMPRRRGQRPLWGGDGLALGLVYVGGVTLRAGSMRQPMRYDEAYTYLAYAGKPLAIGLSQYDLPNNHVFHTLLVHFSCRCFGANPQAIRLPAFIGGVALLPMTYVVGRSLYGPFAGLSGAALVACSSAFICYSTYGRGYSLVCLYTLMLAAIGFEARDVDSAAAWAWFALIAAVGLWTVPVMLYPLGGIALWLALEARAGGTPVPGPLLLRRLARALICTGALATLLYLPVLLRGGPRALVANRWVTPDVVHLPHDLRHWLRSAWFEWRREYASLPGAALLAGAGVGMLRHRRVGRTRVSLPACMLGWSAVVLLATRRVPFHRVGLFALPVFGVLAAAGLEDLSRPLLRRLPTAARAAAVLALAVAQGRRVIARGLAEVDSELPDAPAIVQFLRPRLHAGVVVLAAVPSDAVLRYYFATGGIPDEFLRMQHPPEGASRDLAHVQRAAHTLFVVVNVRYRQTPAGVAALFGLDPGAMGVPVLEAQFASARVYRVPLRR